MKSMNQLLLLGGLAVLASFGTRNLAAQDQPPPGRGNFDPAQFRQRMMDRYKERLEVTSDDEWKVIQDRIEKVTQLQRDLRIGGPGGFGGRRGGPGGPGGDAAQNDNNGPRADRRGMFGGEPNPDAEALQKALDSKASSEELKGKLAKLREMQKDKEAKLAKAQDDLRKVLSVRQEATAVLLGLLK